MPPKQQRHRCKTLSLQSELHAGRSILALLPVIFGEAVARVVLPFAGAPAMGVRAGRGPADALRKHVRVYAAVRAASAGLQGTCSSRQGRQPHRSHVSMRAADVMGGGTRLCAYPWSRLGGGAMHQAWPLQRRGKAADTQCSTEQRSEGSTCMQCMWRRCPSLPLPPSRLRGSAPQGPRRCLRGTPPPGSAPLPHPSALPAASCGARLP